MFLSTMEWLLEFKRSRIADSRLTSPMQKESALQLVQALVAFQLLKKQLTFLEKKDQKESPLSLYPPPSLIWSQEICQSNTALKAQILPL